MEREQAVKCVINYGQGALSCPWMSMSSFFTEIEIDMRFHMSSSSKLMEAHPLSNTVDKNLETFCIDKFWELGTMFKESELCSIFYNLLTSTKCVFLMVSLLIRDRVSSLCIIALNYCFPDWVYFVCYEVRSSSCLYFLSSI